MFKNHPKGLPVLFFTEMWERFGFYLMLGIFTLYMVDTQKNGLAMSPKEAADVYGTYIALVYLTPFVGGLLADRVLGYRKSIVIGGILMGLGYCGLAIPGKTVAFWGSLLLIILGNGLFKPNISTLVGNLYDDDRYRPHKDAGFNIFYMGINIGAFVCNFVAAYMRNTYGWGWAFAAAGVGMFIGVLWFLLGQKHTATADVRKPMKEGDEPLGRILGKVFGPALAFALVGWFAIPALFQRSLISQSTDAFLFACIPVTWFYFSLWLKAKGEDKERIGGLLPIFAVVIVFWAIFHQNGSALTLWAENFTDRELPSAVAGVATKVGMVQEVEAGDPYFQNLPDAQRPAAGSKTPLLSAELFQSVNPFFVVLFTPLVVGLFAFLRRRRKEPSTPGKIALGLFITATSTLVMVAATYATHNGASKGAPWWLVGTYAVITLGELCLSPMGLSLVSKLSPARLTAVMMGGWFLSTAVGNKLSGVLSGFMTSFEHKSTVFLLNLGGAATAGILIVLMLPRLKRIMQKYMGEGAPQPAQPAAAAPANADGTPAA